MKKSQFRENKNKKIDEEDFHSKLKIEEYKSKWEINEQYIKKLKSDLEQISKKYLNLINDHRILNTNKGQAPKPIQILETSTELNGGLQTISSENIAMGTQKSSQSSPLRNSTNETAN